MKKISPADTYILLMECNGCWLKIDFETVNLLGAACLERILKK